MALTFIIFSGALGAVAMLGSGGADEPHGPIEIDGDQALRQNACACVRNPNASGTATDPFVISDWRITDNSGPAIVVRNIQTEHFVIRDNTLEGKVGVRLDNTGDRGTVLRNQINYRETGVDLRNSATDVNSNVIQGIRSTHNWPGEVGIAVDGGSPTIRANTITDSQRGINAESSSAVIRDNHIVGASRGISLFDSASAEIRDNTLRLSERWGLMVEDSAMAELTGNDIRGGYGGVWAESASLLYMANNTITNQDRAAVRFTDTEVKMFRNTISDNWRGAVGSLSSDLLIKENIFRNNGDDAIKLQQTRGTVEDNLLELNEGTALDIVHSIIDLNRNRLYNNSYAFSIPYDSAQTIAKMNGNIVNGVNVDGTINASEQRLFYKRAGVTLTNQTIDSGHSNGYYGVHTEQGAVVLYDTSNARIENVTFSNNNPPDNADGQGRAVFIHNGFNVRIQDSTFRNNAEAVVSVDARVFFKDNICDIDIDPPDTVCFEAKGGFAAVRANLMANVDIGVKFGIKGDVAAKGIIEDNQIRATTHAALVIEGNHKQTEHDVKVLHNSLEANVMGAVLVDFHGRLESNTIGNNTWAAVHLDGGSNATFVENKIVANAKGIVDVNACSDRDRTHCSSGVFVRKRI